MRSSGKKDTLYCYRAVSYTHLYKCNESEIRRHQIQIVLPAKGRMQSGLESLVLENGRATNEAYTNMRILMEVLRPIWEETEGYLEDVYKRQLLHKANTTQS